MSCPPTDRPPQDIPLPAPLRSSPLLPPVRGAYQPHSLPARMHDLRHTPRHHPRHAPYPPPSLRPSHTPSLDEEDIGSSDSSSTTSDYSSGDSEGSKDQLEEEEEEEGAEGRSQGFGFSAATWSSTKGAHGAPPPVVHGSEGPRRARVMYEDMHYVMEERHSTRYYPAPHQPRPPTFTRGHAGASAHHARRSSLSPAPARSYAYRRPVSPEPLYREYREYRHHRDRDRLARTSRSSQTSPVRIEPVHGPGPRSFVRALTPSRYRRARASDDDKDKHRQKYQYESRVPPPPPSLSAPLTLRPAPVARPQLSSNAHKPTRPPPDTLAPPRLVLAAPDPDLGEDEVDDDDDRPAAPRPVRTLLSTPGGSSTSTFVLSGGASAPANNNGTTSTTTTFHVTTPRAISASLAAAQNAASQSGVAALQPDSEKVEAEKMRIPSFKRGGKTRYECLYCKKDFSRKNDAYRHMSRKHNDNATEFICVCGRVLSRGDALTRHMRTCRESKEKGTQGQAALALAGGAFAQGAQPKVPGGQGRKKAGKKRRGSEMPLPPPGAMDMDVDGEEELLDNDDASMEEED
ncbi:hypothetical protein C0992_005192 [Termitomyces sp. T32_za158]|nr:hypothetical protein C0992_005192 [Termitomyces sp. T32_za158]